MSFGDATSGEWVGDSPNEKFVFTLRHTYVFIYNASIIDVSDVDVIINATNGKLATGAGVAAVIAQKAGKTVTNECSRYIDDNGAVPVTENFVSTAGNLPYHGIIHVNGPTWNDYKNQQSCAKDLYNTIINGLMAARERGWSRVALPAVSSGRSGVPKQLCAEMYMLAFAEFALNGPDGLKEVHFVDTSDEMIDLVCDAQEKWYKNPHTLSFENASNYPKPKAMSAVSGQGAVNDLQTGSSGSDYFLPPQRPQRQRTMPVVSGQGARNVGQPANLGQTPFMQPQGYQPHARGHQGQQGTRRRGVFTGFGEESKYKFHVANLRVYVYQSSITEIIGMDAITNSTINTLEHRCGVALTISKAAGNVMNDACWDYVRNHGNVKVTCNYVSVPGYLQCKGIVHAVGPQWDHYNGLGNDCARDLFQTVINVLASVKQKRWQKVALCAISAEHSGVPKQICAEMYVKAITEFAERDSGSVTEVHFVDIDTNMLDMVVKAHKQWVKNPNSLSFDNAN